MFVKFRLNDIKLFVRFQLTLINYLVYKNQTIYAQLTRAERIFYIKN